MTQTEVLSQLAAFARVVEPTLDQKSYYDLLNITASADSSAIRAAYYRLASQLHPDRYVLMTDGAAKGQLESIYSRITEGYRVLTDPEKRAAYDKALAEGRKRLTTTDRERRGPKNPEDTLKHPDAKKFFRLGVLSMGKQDWKGAIMNFNFARTYEPQGAIINEKLAEAQAAQAKAAPKAQTAK